MATLTDIRARIPAILTGVYPPDPLGPTARRLPPNTWAQGSFRKPQGNAKFPVQSMDRRFDMRWVDWEYESPSPNAANQLESPVLVRFEPDLRISYPFTQPKPLAPQGSQLDMGAFESATARALDDWTAIAWALLWPENYEDLVVSLDRRAKATTSVVDGLRVELLVPLRIMAWVDLSSMPAIDP